MQLQKNLPKIREAGVRVVAISYDSVEVLKEFAKKHEVEFPLLSDSSSRTIEAYHVRNDSAQSGARKGIAHPGTFLIDDQGVVRAKIFYSVVKRHGPDELIKTAKSLR